MQRYSYSDGFRLMIFLLVFFPVIIMWNSKLHGVSHAFVDTNLDSVSQKVDCATILTEEEVVKVSGRTVKMSVASLVETGEGMTTCVRYYSDPSREYEKLQMNVQDYQTDQSAKIMYEMDAESNKDSEDFKVIDGIGHSAHRYSHISKIDGMITNLVEFCQGPYIIKLNSWKRGSKKQLCSFDQLETLAKLVADRLK